MKKKVILLVEDEPKMLKLYRNFLKGENYCILESSNGRDALSRAGDEIPDVIVLDVVLPDMCGYEACKILRHNSMTRRIPIILTTSGVSEEDEINGFKAGAADCLKKPISKKLLKHCVKAVFMRKKQEEKVTGSKITINGLSIDSKTRTVLIDDNHVYLNLKEYEILSLLIKNKDCIISKGYLFSHVWGYDYKDINSNTLKVNLHNLRKKIGTKTAEKIVNVPKRGYVFMHKTVLK